MRSKRRPNHIFGVVLVGILLSSTFAARAQIATPTPKPSPVPSPTPSLESQFFKNVLRDQKAIWTAPFHLDRQDAKWLVPLSLGTMALITTDRITGDEIAETNTNGNASRIISYAGSAYTLVPVTAAFYLIGREKKDARARETGILGAEALLNSGIVVAALKGITQRTRPHGGRDRSEFFDGGNSFPSGHATAAWSLASVIADEYSDHRAVQVAAYGVASAVSVARFTGGKHYLSDVLVGSALGFGIGQYVYHAHHRKETDADGQQDEHSVSRWPYIEPEYSRQAHEYGVALTWRF